MKKFEIPTPGGDLMLWRRLFPVDAICDLGADRFSRFAQYLSYKYPLSAPRATNEVRRLGPPSPSMGAVEIPFE
jgi:hypothetical protein